MEMEEKGLLSHSRGRTNPWLVILLTAPIPILIFVLFFQRWYQERTDFTQLSVQFVQRQNTILAYDAMDVSRRISELFEGVATDVRTLALVRPSRAELTQFYALRASRVTQVDLPTLTVEYKRLPQYNELIYFDAKGKKRFHLRDGEVSSVSGSVHSCDPRTLCDPSFLRALWKLPPGEVRFGKLMRWYSPKGKPEIETGAHWPVGYRTEDGLFLLGLDYRHVKEILYLPTFPYEPKRHLLRGYQRGHYIYFVDSDRDVVIHPKYWHVTGVDEQSGKRMRSVKTDEDFGKVPLNFVAYQGDRLKQYLNRLLKISFTQRSIDIFRAPNVVGTVRVLSVAPILLSEGQFRGVGVMGYVVVGCAVDHFEEPKEKFLPYY